MSQLVHVILPSGTRHERTFHDKATPEYILAALNHIKHVFGYNQTKRAKDPKRPELGYQTYADESSGFVFDHPQTIVAILMCEKSPDGGIVGALDPADNPVELTRLKGPAAPGVTAEKPKT